MKEHKIDVNVELFKDCTLIEHGEEYLIIYRVNREQFMQWREAIRRER